MDKLNHYRQCIQSLLTRYASYSKNNPEIETQIVFDTERNHYLLLRTGWDREHRVHYCTFHFDIKDEKIWIQENNTDVEIGEELEEMGIPKQDIVVGFHPYYLRQYTQYSVS
ncbi:MAG TPA: XisI protein [Cyanobacteria bacterium UBA11149]|nr:XisI protein [Cyanobacteria bacterium UBA11367]HBE58363.1 XisI protein [Cyanobacteria bacterium UBA11366]HBK65695.1 XisI protein [Cyanobacteria bacterium UBA11166]HBR76921.1 XisI protein [Cyanobacteria bacterium UBA11159]HBS72244.1 XisI protein [Cyanobacteria bacterium UBA11153]HBW88416.1 XisI protein [Cyanobacteria bacterium UBA11149]HCA95500.1 XisI protein [Cyanobacteria bacterium UBA9226]